MGGLGTLLILSPAGLAAGLVALMAPLAIHLISRSRGRRVPIGNIRLVRAAQRKRVYELKLTQRILLALRLALLAVAALVLGGLAIPGSEQHEGDVAYVTPAWLQASGPDGPASLATDQRNVFVLSPGFPAPEEFENREVAEPYDIWPLLAERLSTVEHSGEVQVFTAGRLDEFGAFRPRLPRAVRWFEAESATTRPATTRPPRLATEVLLIHPDPPDDRAAAVEQALELIRQHRLPELEWRRASAHSEPPANESGAVIWASPGPAPARNRAEPVRWIDLNDPNWNQAWREADFPERLTDALLSAEQSRLRWAGAAVDTAAFDRHAVAVIEPDQMPRRLLHPWLGLLLILLWGLERWLSERSTHEPV